MQQSEITLDELGLTTKGPSKTPEVPKPKPTAATPVKTVKKTPVVPKKTTPAKPVVTVKKTPAKPVTPARSATPAKPVYAPKTQAKPVYTPKTQAKPVYSVQQPRREIVEETYTQEDVEEAYEDAISKARQSKSITHVYGQTHTNKAEVMCTKILSQYPNEKILLVCASTKEAARIHSNNKKDRKVSSGLITEETTSYDANTNSIICTDSISARTFVKNMRDSKKTSKEDLSWVIVNSFDYEDINATVVCGLLSEFECSVVVMSISFASYVPTSNYTDLRTYIPLPSVTTKYIDLNEMNKVISATTQYTQLYTYSNAKPLNPKVVNVGGNPTEFNKNTKAIIDNAYISERGGTLLKHDIIADAIAEGVVYRVCSSTEHYGLKVHKPLEMNKKDLKEVTKFLESIDMTPSDIFGSDIIVQAGDTPKYFESHGITEAERKAIKDIRIHGFSRQGSLFYVRYLAKTSSAGRDHYCAGLVANLISMKLDSFADEALGDEAKQNLFTPFLGRNDIETLTNVWSSLLLVCEDKLYYRWNTRNNSFVAWCNLRGFNVKTMESLWHNMSILANNTPNVTFKDFKDVTTTELNLMSKVLTTVLNLLPSTSKPVTINNKFGKQGTIGACELMKGKTYSLIVKGVKFVDKHIPEEDFSDL